MFFKRFYLFLSMSYKERQPKKIAELICDIKDSWDYLHELTSGKEDILRFADFNTLETPGEVILRMNFFCSSFLDEFKIPPCEFTNPREVSLLEFYLDFLNLRISEKEKRLLDFTIECNLSYLESLLSYSGRRSVLPSFLRKKGNKYFISRDFMQWAELSRSYLEEYSKRRGLSVEESVKEHYLSEVVREIEEIEKSNS